MEFCDRPGDVSCTATIPLKVSLMSSFRLVPSWLLIAGIIVLAVCTESEADQDWPMWRYDAGRTAASPNAAPSSFRKLWKQTFSPRVQVWDDPLNLDLMTYDRVFEPIVLNGRMFVGFNDQDKLLAIDTRTGEQLWTFFADGPIRLPPVGWQDRVFACSDDGCLYCLEAATGQLIWKFSGAPNSQHVIGNQRLTSAWPARGGAVVRDNTVYFASSIWPFMGTFIYALNVESGRVEWVNDNTGAQYIKQPHSAPSFAGVAPQGALVATEEFLIVPGGRSVPAVFGRSNGEFKYFEINAGGKGTGGSFVAANDHDFFVHTREKGTRAFRLQTGLKTAFMPNEPVITEELIFSAEEDEGRYFVRAYDATVTDDRSRTAVWSVEADGTGDLILANNQLIAAGGESISVIQLSSASDRSSQAGRVVQTSQIDEPVSRILVADHKLFVVTSSGSIVAYGDAAPSNVSLLTETEKVHQKNTNAEAAKVVSDLFEAGDASGFGFWFGRCESGVTSAIAAQSRFVQFAIVDSDAARVKAIRQQLDEVGRYGKITAHESDAAQFRSPQFVGNIVCVAEDLATTGTPELIKSIYRSVRPYGGVMHLLAGKNIAELADKVRSFQLEQAEIETGQHGVIVRRIGALPGSGDWTHQYGDVANTIKSNDQRVKLPLGILWFGGSSNMDVLPRHGHGPPEQVVGGRLFIEGINILSARDVYTGRILWKRQFDDLGTYDVYFDATYEDTPLDPKYNQVHIPGANGRGTNYVVTEDRVYLIAGNKCLILDPADGKDLGEIQLPHDEDGGSPEWGYIGIYKDVLIGGLGFAEYRQRHQLEFESDKSLKTSHAGFGSKSLDRAASRGLVGFDRYTGKVLWQVNANHSFWHNGIVAGGGRVYCLDRNPAQVEEAMRRRGLSNPGTYRILAIDYQTGQTKWQVNDGIFGTWLSYSKQHDLLLQAGAQASDRLTAEVGQGMATYNADNGSMLWKHDSLKYSGPCILHNDTIITNANAYTDSAGAFDILTGKQKMITNPVTGDLQPWKINRAYGCNSIIASENLLTFRSGAAGYYDLLTDSGTGNLGGFKSGCTANLVVANGVLNAPDYTRTCSCSYQNQTSLALIHMPDIDVWSVSTLAATEGKLSVKSMGINFGAPGDRRDAEGTMWLEYPPVSGDSPALSVEVNPAARTFQQHSSTVDQNAELPWVFASGLDNVTELSVRLNDDKQSTQLYDVELYFALPPGAGKETRSFDVYLQDQPATVSVVSLTDGNPVASVNPTENHLVQLSDESPAVKRLWRSIVVGQTLEIKLLPKQGQPALSGLKVRRVSE